MTLSIRDLEYLIALAETQNFSKAAEKLLKSCREASQKLLESCSNAAEKLLKIC